MTHPFHPLAGRHLSIVFERRYRAHGLVFICEDGASGTLTLPADFSDLGPPASDRSLNVEVLVELVAVISALRGC